MNRRTRIFGLALLTALLGAPVPSDSLASDGGESVGLAEIPYPKVFGPLASCRGLEARGTFPAHWGGVTAVGDIEVGPRSIDRYWDSSIPWASPYSWVYLGVPWSSYPGYSQIAGSGGGTEIEDPWFSVRTLGSITDAPNAGAQPWPTDYDTCCSPYDPDRDHSNLFQRDPHVRCPEVPYGLWKSIAQQEGHYLTWVDEDRFEGGGIIKTFQEWTHGQAGLWFFDTRNSLEPDGMNLTPPIRVQGAWFARGFLYLHAESLRSLATKGREIAMVAPGEPFTDLYVGSAGYTGVYNAEPFTDANGNSIWDPGEAFVDTIRVENGGSSGLYDAEPWVNLDYATRMASDGSPPRHRVVTLPGTETFSLTLDGLTTSRTTTNARDAEGLPVRNEVNFYGLLYTAGRFSLQGTGSFFGAVIAGGGMGEDERGPSSGGKASIYFDARLSRGNWPPPELELPQTFLTAWEEH